MTLNTFYQAWGLARGFVLTALILAFLALTLRSYCHTFEMDYSGPGSEFDRSLEQYRDNENREAAEREGNGIYLESDHNRAEQYRDDHGV